MSAPGRGERRSQFRALLGSLDLALVTFGLATGVLAVGAGELVHGGGQPGGLTQTTSLLVTVTIAGVAVRIGDPLLRWLRPPWRSHRTRWSGLTGRLGR